MVYSLLLNYNIGEVLECVMAPEQDPRISKAFRAMRSLGISVETVKPVLRKLLKLYDRNWELIEEDNYRTLADAIFEYADEFPCKVQSSKIKVKTEQKGATSKDDVEPPYKKAHINLQEDPASYTENSGKNGINLAVKIPKNSSSSGMKTAESTPFLKDPTSEHRRGLYKPIGSKGKDPIQVDSALVKEKSYIKREAGTHYANPTPNVAGFGSVRRDIKYGHENKNAIGQRKQPFNSLQSSVPASNICHGLIETSQHSDEREKNNSSGSACIQQTIFQTTRDVASSTCGQVQLSLKCNRAKGQHNFHIPNSDELLRFVENKYKKSYKIVGPNFSLQKLLNEICASYLEIGADCVNSDPKNKLSGNHIYPEANIESTRTDHPARNLGKRVSSCSGSSVSRASVIGQKQPGTHSSKNGAVRKVCDITNGTEKLNISLLDEIGNEDFPSFVYVPENIIYQSAYVHVSLARISDEDCCSSCKGDCLSSSIPCACARDTGGEFAYTPEGLLNEKFLCSCISMNQEPQNHHLFYCQDCPLERAKNANMPEKCKGHLLRKFIKECWRKCGCKMKCGNRVVQRGITRKLQVFLTSEGKGWGVRTLEELPKGAYVCEYAGEILTNMELYERNKQSSGNEKHVYPVLLDADWATEGVLKDEDALCLDATYYGNVARFINHRCFDANLLEIPVQVETPDRHYYHLAFFTKRKVDALEELTWDYGIDFDDHNHPIKAFKCQCGSQYCRDRERK